MTIAQKCVIIYIRCGNAYPLRYPALMGVESKGKYLHLNARVKQCASEFLYTKILSRSPGPVQSKFNPLPRIFFLSFWAKMLDKFFILCYNIFVNQSKRGIKMKRVFWELIFPNRIVYYFGTKAEILAKILSQKPITMNPISKKSLMTMMKTNGVQKIL